jgi:hypothetical protein
VKKFLQCTLAACVLLVGAAMAHAQTKPVLVVTAPSFDELLASVDFIGGLAGQPDAKMMVEGILQQITGGQGLKGLDRTKPIAAVVGVENGVFAPIIFIPSTSAKELTDTLTKLNLLPPAQDDGGALKLMLPTGQEVFVRDHAGYAAVTQGKSVVLPADPLQAFGGLNKTYDLGIRVYLPNVPPDMKAMAVEQIKGVMKFGAAQQQAQGEDPLGGLSQKSIDDQVKAIERLFNEADQFTIGWKLDRAAKNTFLDIVATAVPGSTLDREWQQLADAKSNFAGFLSPEAAVTANFAGKLAPQDIEQGVATIQELKKKAEQAVDKDTNLADPKAREQVKTVLRQLIDVIEKTVRTGKSDGGVIVMAGPNKLQVGVGAFVADGPGLEVAVKNLVNLAKGEAEFNNVATVKLDLETYKDVKFHQVTVKVPADQPDAKRVFGDTLDVYFGAGKESAYLAAGKGSLEMLKGAIDRSAASPNKSVLPFQLTIALSPIIDYAASIHSNPQLDAFSKALAANKGKDRILVTEKPISNGVNIRVAVEEGILQAAGAVGQARMGGGPRPR